MYAFFLPQLFTVLNCLDIFAKCGILTKANVTERVKIGLSSFKPISAVQYNYFGSTIYCIKV